MKIAHFEYILTELIYFPRIWRGRFNSRHISQYISVEKLSNHPSTSFIGVFLGLISLAIVKLTYPHAISLHGTVKRIIANPQKAQNSTPDQFALAVLKRNKEVFERLAEM